MRCSGLFLRATTSSRGRRARRICDCCGNSISYLERPYFGSRRVAVELNVNRKRMQRLMRLAGIEALYSKPNLSRTAPGHEIHPYLLREVVIERPNHVWSADITYIPMRAGFLYLGR